MLGRAVSVVVTMVVARVVIVKIVAGIGLLRPSVGERRRRRGAVSVVSVVEVLITKGGVLLLGTDSVCRLKL